MEGGKQSLRAPQPALLAHLCLSLHCPLHLDSRDRQTGQGPSKFSGSEQGAREGARPPLTPLPQAPASPFREGSVSAQPSASPRPTSLLFHFWSCKPLRGKGLSSPIRQKAPGGQSADVDLAADAAEVAHAPRPTT